MIDSAAIVVFLFLAFLAANLPWLSDRLFFVLPPERWRKSGWLRWLEWFLMYWVTGLMAAGLEYRLMGSRSPQDWEFYVVGLCLFLVFALPGFIYCYDLKKVLAGRR